MIFARSTGRQSPKSQWRTLWISLSWPGYPHNFLMIVVIELGTRSSNGILRQASVRTYWLNRGNFKTMGAIKAVGDQKSSPYKVYSGVLTGLYEGRFVPGQRLVEADLSRIYQVSRNSVREALSRLAAERVILLSPNRGAQIRLLTRVEARGILEMLALLIGLAARLAAKHIHEAKAAEQFESILNRLLSFEKQPDSLQFLRARNVFYRKLVEIGGNDELMRVMPSMHVHLLRVQFRQFYPVPETEGFREYRRIGKAVLAGDWKRAELAGQIHVRRIANNLDDLPDDAFDLMDNRT
jgi:DNA-binding GntR family transcriptional regulator